MTRFHQTLFVIVTITLTVACNKKAVEIKRPRDPWAFRSVIDKQPRMLTLALDSECYVTYDLAHCTLYKAWKGGVILEGAAYTNKKNIQPATWGKSYFTDSLRPFKWTAMLRGKLDSFQMINRGYIFRQNQIYLKHILVLSSKDTIHIEERPEFVRNESGQPGLERFFTVSGAPDGVTISLQSRDSIFNLNANSTTLITNWFNKLPDQFPPKLQEDYDARGKYWMEKSDCFTCHELDKPTVGPSLHQIAERYPNEESNVLYLIRKVQRGGTGVWGNSAMTPHGFLKDNEIKVMLDYILSLRPKGETKPASEKDVEEVTANKYNKPLFGAALEGIHPSYTLATIHKHDFQPRVGGLAFLPDGRMLVTTWDSIGGVYLLDGVETGDTNKITVKRIASGLAEPLGIQVVNGQIYVLQKQELTHLIDLDGDDVVDEYQAVCNTWGATGDFHEFALGLTYKDNHFYVTLGMAMRLISGEQQKPDRGRTIKIAMDGSYEWVNSGLRMPNGITVGPDGELFETDNQGEWTPANKLIHVRQGDFNGMPWGLTGSTPKPPTVPPAIYMPEDEIANSPSQPILMQDGPYNGQLLHGDVTNGGIKRDFLEKINGEYQGVVFRFTTGLEAGVNRLSRGPDSALYIGGIGMVGGWSWKEKQFGLQRLKYNGNSTFEMLAVRAKPRGFEIEFTQPLSKVMEITNADFFIQQWWYLPTAGYGGPKMDLENMKVSHVEISKDRTRVLLEIPGLKKGNVVYFSLPERIHNDDGQSLWSSEAWYTLNNIP
ncbi:MAG: c-type cytochrome [Ginsengibacter sp.]